MSPQPTHVSRANLRRCCIFLNETSFPLKAQDYVITRRGWHWTWLNRTWFDMRVNESICVFFCFFCFFLFHYAPGAGAEKCILFPSTEPTLPRCNRASPARIFFWPNCRQWLNPIHLHRSPLKRDADELNECANYARSAWGACCNCNFVCVCVCVCVRVRVLMHIWNFMPVHA